MIQWFARSVCRLWLAALCAVIVLGAAQAHFLLNINIRVIHVEHLDDGLRIYLRLPMPYLLADKIGAPREDGTVEPAPFSFNRLEEGEVMHYLDLAALRRDPHGLGQLVAEGHRVTVAGRDLSPEVEYIRVFPGLSQTPFATLEEAKGSLEGPLYPPSQDTTYIGDLVVDTVLRYRSGTPVYDYAFSSSLDPGLERQDETANVLLDYFPGSDPLIYRVRGLLRDPIEVSRSPLAAALTFMLEGIRHILEGTDHVLFVLCLTIGAVGLTNLLWRVTGFTLGHTATLILGFFGFVPAGAWFVPAVETGIAVSIIYAGVVAALNKPSGATFVVTALIGLLHGLGFSFVLHEILQVDSPNLWQSLLSFNLGVELGQVAIVAAVYPVMVLVGRRSVRLGTISRWAVALPCITVAALWTGQRALSVVAAL